MTTTRARERQEQISALSFRLTMSQARAQSARDAEWRRAEAARRRLAELEPLLAKAGYGPHGAATWLRAEARAIAARSARRSGDAECSGPGCRVCAEGRQRDAGPRGSQARSALRDTREITRYVPTPRCSGCGYVYCKCGR